MENRTDYLYRNRMMDIGKKRLWEINEETIQKYIEN